MKVADLRDLILGSGAHKNDPESVENFLSSIMEARKRKEEQSYKLKLEIAKVAAERRQQEQQLELERAELARKLLKLEKIVKACICWKFYDY
ncbi:hypothetical protein AVEN_12006-1 [Araneus ventricosus]|uniref:Uncharacterized protein n=1 Tax=Araneus ventricosus TaxID=182803 RepID=A0A4Y2G901_ARAVE|nr:hypothetical protein AVEN_12006-1 [Araneus ventricosus]